MTSRHLSGKAGRTGILTYCAAQVMARMSGSDARKEWSEEPTPFKLGGKDAFIIRLGVPVVNPHTNEVVANIACLLNIAAIETVVEEVIKENDGISAMSIYTDTGSILGSYVPERVGKKLIDVDAIYGDNIKAANQAVLDGKEFRCTSYSAVLGTNVVIDLKPFKIGNSDTTWTVMIASAESYILKEVNEMTRFAVIIAAL
jgi:methyl-accepting chemotaxis protein